MSTLALGYPLLDPSRHVRAYYCMPCSPALAFSIAINFAMKRPAPCSTVVRHSPPSWAAVVHWSALISKALRSFRKHPIHSSFFSLSSHAARAPHQFSKLHARRDSSIFSPRILHMRTKNLANRIGLLCIIALMPSLPKRVPIGNRVLSSPELVSSSLQNIYFVWCICVAIHTIRCTVYQ